LGVILPGLLLKGRDLGGREGDTRIKGMDIRDGKKE
jgi:hypothetical protein